MSAWVTFHLNCLRALGSKKQLATALMLCTLCLKDDKPYQSMVVGHFRPNLQKYVHFVTQIMHKIKLFSILKIIKIRISVYISEISEI